MGEETHKVHVVVGRWLGWVGLGAAPVTHRRHDCESKHFRRGPRSSTRFALPPSKTNGGF